MPDIKLKVCGLRDNAIEVIEDIKPDYAGFIYFDKSPRYVADFDVSSVTGVKKIGVFVNAPIDFIQRKIEEDGLNLIQLHGDETPEYCARIKGMAEVIKVIAGNKNTDLQREVDEYGECVDYYLFDTKTEKHGGTGIRFDWQKLGDINIKKPVFLSGGIDLDAVEMLRDLDVKLHAIDVNSKFEDKPGLKNIEKLKTLKNKLR